MEKLDSNNLGSVAGGAGLPRRLPTCKICGFKAIAKTLTEHLLQSHTHKEGFTYYCNYCQAKLGHNHKNVYYYLKGNANSGLIGHMVSNHVERKSPS